VKGKYDTTIDNESAYEVLQKRVAGTAATAGGGSGEANCPNRTLSGFSPALPDCRAYELVSSAIDESYVPEYGELGSATEGGTGGVSGEVGRYRASSDGDRLAYMGGPSATGFGGSGKTGNGNGNHYLSIRGAGGGWEASDVDLPINASTETSQQDFQGFSDDLSVQTVEAMPTSVFATRCARRNTPNREKAATANIAMRVTAGA